MFQKVKQLQIEKRKSFGNNIIKRKSNYHIVFAEPSTPSVENFITAALEDNLTYIRKFLTYGMDPNCHLGDYVTALHIAADYNYFGLLCLLLENSRTKVNVIDDMGNTPLHIATLRNFVEAVRRLIKHQADVNKRNKYGNSPLHTAVQFKNQSIVELLLTNGANADTENIFGKTPLYLAVLDNPSHRNMNLLIEYGADPDRNNGKIMPIIVEGALQCINMKRLDYLLDFMDKGCDVNIQDKMTGRTAMHMVAMTGFFPMAQALIANGASYDIKDKLMKTPMDVAYMHGNTTMFAYLQYFKYTLSLSEESGYTPP